MTDGDTAFALQSEQGPVRLDTRKRHRVTNWAEYDAGLRARGSLTVWFTEEAIECRRVGCEAARQVVLGKQRFALTDAATGAQPLVMARFDALPDDRVESSHG